MSATATHVRPSSEFRGMARAWLNTLDHDDSGFNDPAKRMVDRVRESLAKGKRATPEMLQGLAKRWRELPASGRLRLDIECSKRLLTIRDLRMARSKQFLENWIDKEDALVIYFACVIARRSSHLAQTGLPGGGSVSNCTFHRELRATISLFALSRRFQRGFDLSDEAIRADLIALADATEENYHGDGRFSVRTPDGAWAGRLHVFDKDDSYGWAARTFLSDAEIAAA